MTWQQVSDALPSAHSIAWDGCHKIYVLMDSNQTDLMITYGYGDTLIRMDNASRQAAYHVLTGWFEDSCSLRFIEAVRTIEGDANEGFTNLIEQGEFEDERVLGMTLDYVLAQFDDASEFEYVSARNNVDTLASILNNKENYECEGIKWSAVVQIRTLFGIPEPKGGWLA